MRFTNDSCSACGGPPVGGGDRNLFVGSITIGSTVIAPNDPSVSYTGCNRSQDGVGSLWCNGDMIVSLAPAMVGQRITVNAYGSPDYDVYPHMQLLVNGTIVGEWDVPGGAQNYSARAVHYYVSDHLGSTSIVTDSKGVVRQESDYYPYGGERMVTGGDSNHYKFTGKERDAETGLDYFGARYYGSNMGRWMSPDWSAGPEAVPYADFAVPQSLNLYTYGKNNPTSYVDKDGHLPFIIVAAAAAAATYFVIKAVQTYYDVKKAQAEHASAEQSRSLIIEAARQGGANKTNIDQAQKDYVREKGQALVDTVKAGEEVNSLVGKIAGSKGSGTSAEKVVATGVKMGFDQAKQANEMLQQQEQKRDNPQQNEQKKQDQQTKSKQQQAT